MFRVGLFNSHICQRFIAMMCMLDLMMVKSNSCCCVYHSALESWCTRNADLEALNRQQDWLIFTVHYYFATFKLNIYIKDRKDEAREPTL